MDGDAGLAHTDGQTQASSRPILADQRLDSDSAAARAIVEQRNRDCLDGYLRTLGKSDSFTTEAARKEHFDPESLEEYVDGATHVRYRAKLHMPPQCMHQRCFVSDIKSTQRNAEACAVEKALNKLRDLGMLDKDDRPLRVPAQDEIGLEDVIPEITVVPKKPLQSQLLFGRCNL